MTLKAIKYENNTLEILDQLLLPAQSKYIPVQGVEDGWRVINKMQVQQFNHLLLQYSIPLISFICLCVLIFTYKYLL